MNPTPLFSASDIGDILGTFDPLLMGLTFANERMRLNPTPPSSPGAGKSATAEAVTTAEEIIEAQRQLFDGVPTTVLAHELTHLQQTAATSSGIRNFIDMHTYVLRCMWVMRAMTEMGDGQVKVGLLKNLDWRWEDLTEDLQSALDAMFGGLVEHLLVNGGILAPVEDLRRYRAHPEEDTGNMFRVRGLFPLLDTEVWCLDLTDLGGPAGMGVTLGNVHLYEGQAVMVEWHRAITEWSRKGAGDADFVSPLDTAPFHPYRIAYAVYKSLVKDRPSGAIPPDTEFMLVADTALMYDDWATIPPEALRTREYDWGNGHAFHHFIAMCRALRKNPELCMKGVGVEEVVRFQDALLSAIDAPVPSVHTLTTAARRACPRIVAEIQQANPAVSLMVGTWASSFEELLKERDEDGKGGSRLFGLMVGPEEGLRLWAITSVPSLFVRYPSFTDGIGADHPAFRLYAGMHVKPLLEEIVHGRGPCPARAECNLPERAACSGLINVEHITPEGERCTREGAILDIIERFGVKRFVHPTDENPPTP